MGAFKILETPIKSESDKKDYRVIELGNGLVACLVSDTSAIQEEESDDEECEWESESESEQESSEESTSDATEFDDEKVHKQVPEQKLAAAGLCIGTGSFHDPPEVPGLAHFLEHMVFMGSEKFPTENDFDSFIQKSGGSDNAATDAETTCFYFEILEKHLLTALDKFAQFFISPLMKKEAISREREAVESEFQMAMPNDSNRKEQLYNSMARQNTPVNSFAWGNLITLRDNIADDDLYAKLHAFRERHYSAHRMTLAIQARLPLDTLQEYVVQCFSNVKNNGIAPPDLTIHKNVFDTPEFRRVYYMQPTKDICQLDLTWALPPLKSKYLTKPHEYLSYLLGDEGKGSILSYLKKKVWVLGISAGNSGSGVDDNSVYSFFSLNLVMTEEGMTHMNEVIDVVFSYLNMLKRLGPQKRIFDEIKHIADTSFKYRDEESASDYVEELCEVMQFYPPKHYLCAEELQFEYNEQDITDVLNQLTADRLNILVMSSKLPASIPMNKKEKWFGTSYADRDIPSDLIHRWNAAKEIPELDLPVPNKYLTEDFDVLPVPENPSKYPVKVWESPAAELWYRQDDEFRQPKAYYYIYMISPMIMESASSSTMLDMLFNLLEFGIGEELYPAISAGLSYKFGSYERGLLLKVSGYNEKLPSLICVLVNHMKSCRIDREIFEAVKRKLIDRDFNRLIRPNTLAKDVRLNLLIANTFGPMEKFKAASELTYEQMVEFTEKYFKNLYVKTLVQGNVSECVAKETIQHLVQVLDCQPIGEQSFPHYTVIEVPNGQHCCRVQNMNPNDSNSIITNYYQIGEMTLRTNVILELIMLFIEEPLFDELRTKQQLGYHVTASLRDTFGILAYTIMINTQATKYTTQHIDSRIESFVKHVRNLLKRLKKDELEELKTTLIKMKRTKDVDMKQEVDRNWSEITEGHYMFDRLEKEIELVGGIGLEDLKQFWNDYNLGGRKFKKLSVQVVGHDVNAVPGSGDKEKNLNLSLLGSETLATSEEKDKDYFILEVDKFKEAAPKFPIKKETIFQK
ncbi:nardilysin isoform X2 [Aethina tumida]|nr:nardilysin isoform X2 [Aethina tumida]XP_049824035.1 nardilysin isoform X2 [Aethina tumida]